MNSTTISLAAKATSVSHVILAQGDCLARIAAIPSNSVDLFLSDLPYGTTPETWDKHIDMDAMWRELYRVGKPDCVFVFTTQAPFTRLLQNSNPKPEKDHRQQLIWNKGYGTNPMNCNNMPLKCHETVEVFCRKGARYNPQMTTGKPYKATRGVGTGGGSNGMSGKRRTGKDNHGTRYPLSILNFPRQRGWHSTQKPVDLMAWLIRTYSNPGQTVLDLTMGSGTTGVAAVREGRDFIGFEKLPKYMKIARLRIRAAQAGKPEPLTPAQKRAKARAAERRALKAAEQKTMRAGRGFGARRQGGKRA